MKRLILSILTLLIATLIFSQGNKGENEDNGVKQDLVKNEQNISSENSI